MTNSCCSTVQKLHQADISESLMGSSVIQVPPVFQTLPQGNFLKYQNKPQNKFSFDTYNQKGIYKDLLTWSASVTLPTLLFLFGLPQ